MTSTDVPFALECQSLVVREGDPPFDAEVSRGRRVAVLARNGAGKSTMLRILAGLARPHAGAVRRPGAIGFAPQAYRNSLLPWFDVATNIALPLRASHTLTHDEINARVERAAETVRLSRALLSRRAERLSGGEQQSVVLARAIVHEPSVLVLDEPFSALDAITRIAVRRALVAHCERTRCAMVMVTHDVTDAVDSAHEAWLFGAGPWHRELVVRGADLTAAALTDRLAGLAPA